MIELCISGTLDKDVVIFSLNGESKTIDQFSKQVHFSLEEKKTYRLNFEQRSEQFIPRHAEIILNILLLPIRAVFNVLTFNTIQNWEKDISAFKISGYIDINLNENTEISFELKQGKFDKNTSKFQRPIISFSPDILVKQLYSPDVKEITKKYHDYILNICSAGALLLALLLYLLFTGLKNAMYMACIITSIFIILFSILIVCLILHSFRKRASLRTALTNQHSSERD